MLLVPLLLAGTVENGTLVTTATNYSGAHYRNVIDY